MACATTVCLQTALATKKRREVVTPVTVNMPGRGEESKKERFDARLDVWQHFQTTQLLCVYAR